MKVLKGYVCNRFRPEASMVESYVAEESVELCYEVLKDIPNIGLPEHKDRAKKGGIFGPSIECVDSKLLAQAHLYVLRNSDVVGSYVMRHMNIISHRAQELHKGLRWIANEHNRTFSSWLSVTVSEEMQAVLGSINETLKWLSYGPRPIVLSYNGFLINGHMFHTETKDAAMTIQNSGVTMAAQSMNAARASDDINPDSSLNQYYDKIEEIWELDYAKFRIPVFKCIWENISSGVRVDDMGFTTIDFNRLGHINDAFILGEQVRQVFYVIDLYNHALSIVLSCETLRGRGFDVTVNVEDQDLSSTHFRKFRTSIEDIDDEPYYRHGSNGE